MMQLPTFENQPNGASLQQLSVLLGWCEGSPVSAGLTSCLPGKLIARIENMEFVETYELLQEAWLPDTSAEAASHGLTLKLPRRSTPVTDISVWVECYSLMASVICRKYPLAAADMWAYMRCIVRSARTFDGNAWVSYDRLYRRQAAASRSLSWGTEDQSLYNKAFAGRAKPLARCRGCLSEHHGSEACPDALALSLPHAPSLRPNPNSQQEVCRRFNQERCYLSSCKYRHSCSSCSGDHPASTCRSGRQRGTSFYPYSRN